MAQSGQNIDFARPFTFVFEDQDWIKKVLIGALYALLIFVCYIGLFALLGYQKRVILNTAEGRDVPLPEFDRFGEDLVEGLKMFVIMMGFVLPGILIYFCGGFLGGFVGAATGEDEIGAMLTIASACIAAPIILLSNFLVPVAIMRYVDTGEMGAPFRLGETWAFLKDNFVNVLLAFVVGVACQMIAQFTILLLCVGIFAGMAWSMIVLGHAYGQVLKIARQRRATGG